MIAAAYRFARSRGVPVNVPRLLAAYAEAADRADRHEGFPWAFEPGGGPGSPLSTTRGGAGPLAPARSGPAAGGPRGLRPLVRRADRPGPGPRAARRDRPPGRPAGRGRRPDPQLAPPVDRGRLRPPRRGRRSVARPVRPVAPHPRPAHAQRPVVPGDGHRLPLRQPRPAGGRAGRRDRRIPGRAARLGERLARIGPVAPPGVLDARPGARRRSSPTTPPRTAAGPTRASRRTCSRRSWPPISCSPSTRPSTRPRRSPGSAGRRRRAAGGGPSVPRHRG